MDALKRPTVAVVYHVFPHYRQPVMERLLASEKYDFILYGDTKSPKYQTLKTWTPANSARFVKTTNWYIPLGYKKHGTMTASMLIQSKLLRLALRSDIDCIIYLVNSLSPSYWLSYLLARLAGKRVVFWSHGMLADERGAKNIIRTALLSLAHANLVYGHRARKFLLDRGFEPETMHVVYNSLDYEAHCAVREKITDEDRRRARGELFEHPDWPLLSSVSRLEAHPRFDLLIEAAALLHQQGFPCNVLLIGDGSERTNLERLAVEKKVPVYFYGACYEPKTVALLTMASDLTVSPGCIGLTAISSLTFGTPVITHGDPCSQGPEWEAIVPGETGAFFECGDINSLARSIREWLQSNRDRGNVSQKCQAMIAKYYTPDNQKRIIEQAVAGDPAEEDPFWWKRFYLGDISGRSQSE